MHRLLKLFPTPADLDRNWLFIRPLEYAIAKVFLPILTGGMMRADYKYVVTKRRAAKTRLGGRNPNCIFSQPRRREPSRSQSSLH